MNLVFQIAAGIVLAYALITQPIYTAIFILACAFLAGVYKILSAIFDKSSSDKNNYQSDDSDLIGNRFLRWLRGK